MHRHRHGIECGRSCRTDWGDRRDGRTGRSALHAKPKINEFICLKMLIRWFVIPRICLCISYFVFPCALWHYVLILFYRIVSPTVYLQLPTDTADDGCIAKFVFNRIPFASSMIISPATDVRMMNAWHQIRTVNCTWNIQQNEINCDGVKWSGLNWTQQPVVCVGVNVWIRFRKYDSLARIVGSDEPPEMTFSYAFLVSGESRWSLNCVKSIIISKYHQHMCRDAEGCTMWLLWTHERQLSSDSIARCIGRRLFTAPRRIYKYMKVNDSTFCQYSARHFITSKCFRTLQTHQTIALCIVTATHLNFMNDFFFYRFLCTIASSSPVYELSLRWK